jgi:hypothetical protein
LLCPTIVARLLLVEKESHPDRDEADRRRR